MSFVLFPTIHPIKLCFFANKEFLSFFVAKLGHLTISDFFLYVTKHSNLTTKIENKKKSFIGSVTGANSIKLFFSSFSFF